MLEGEDHMFILDLALLANRREFLNLQTWLPRALLAAHPDGTCVIAPVRVPQHR